MKAFTKSDLLALAPPLTANDALALAISVLEQRQLQQYDSLQRAWRPGNATGEQIFDVGVDELSKCLAAVKALRVEVDQRVGVSASMVFSRVIMELNTRQRRFIPGNRSPKTRVETFVSVELTNCVALIEGLRQKARRLEELSLTRPTRRNAA
ncbi:hypothetical protein HNP46_005810 [Pseudomonas nitritireducens]|uniref:Uncharacterized protein n=1 Tax=Pseudomonas nitroreducens TaxID=46680 RepID=A0A7W7P3E2_PSENT|nr:hypothetical protein [Pseudomonas nitritireducens]MBB4866903.1 hypothetical protein [Pseudomonas nitritireducens]